MKEEIKEILESLDKIAKGSYYPEDLLYYENCKQLLDYITNLQEEKENQAHTIKTLLEENKELKELEHDYRVELKLTTSYEKRIDKAIELIKEAGSYDEELKTFCDDIWEELPKLLNILKGEDKE